MNVGSRVGSMALSAMNYGREKYLKRKPNDVEALHNDLTSIIMRTTMTLNSLGLSVESLTKAQKEYHKALKSGSKEEQESKHEVLVAVQKLLDLEKSDRQKLSEKVLNRDKINLEEADKLINYTKEINSLVSKLNKSQVNLEGLFETVFDAVADRRISGKHRHESISELVSFLKENEAMSRSTYIKELENILKRDKHIDYFEIKPVQNLLEKLFKEFSAAQSLNQITVDLEDADLKDKGTHSRLDVAADLLSQITSLQEESNVLNKMLLSETRGNERELEQMRSVLRRISDTTAQTKTLHTLDNISQKFDRSLLNDEKLKEAMESGLWSKLKTFPEKISKGKSGFAMLGSILGAVTGLSGLGSMIGGLVTAGAGLLGTFKSLASIGWSLAKGLMLFGGPLLKLMGGLAGFLGKGAYNMFKMAANGVSGLRTKVATPKAVNPKTVPTKGAPVTSHSKVPVKSLPNTKGVPSIPKNAGVPTLAPVKTTVRNSILPKAGPKLGKVGKVGGALALAYGIDQMTGGNVSNAIGNFFGGSSTKQLEELRANRIQRLQNPDLNGDALTSALTDLTDSVDLLNETLLKGGSGSGIGSSNTGNALLGAGAALGGGALLAKSMGAGIGLKPGSILGGMPKTSITAPSVGLTQNTASLSRNALTNGLPHFPKDNKALQTVAKSMKTVGGKAIPLLNAGLSVYEGYEAYSSATNNAERNNAIVDAASSAGGAWAGAAAGAAIGSVVPVVGTVIGGLVGGIAGSLGGSWLGNKFSEWFNDPIDMIPDEAKKAGPIAEALAVDEIIDSYAKAGKDMDKEDLAELIAHKKNVLRPANLYKYLSDQFKAQGLNIKDYTPDQILQSFSNSLAGNANIDSYTANELTSSLGEALTGMGPKVKTVSAEELTARQNLLTATPTGYGYNVGQVERNKNQALVGVYNNATKGIYYSDAIAKNGASALEQMKQSGVDANTIALAEQQLANQNGMSLADFKSTEQQITYESAKGKLSNADGSLIYQAADANLKEAEPTKDLDKKSLDDLKEQAEIAQSNNITAQEKALTSKVTEWLGNSLPQTILPLVGLNPELTLNVMSPDLAASSNGNGQNLTMQSVGSMPMQTGSIGNAYTGATGLDPKLAKNIRTGGTFGGQINGLSNEQAAALAGTLAQRESGGNQTAENSFGYMGLYQFGAAALAETGLIDMNKYRQAVKQNPGIANGSDAKAHKAFLNDPANWTIQGGKQGFLASKDIQDQALGKLMNKNKAYFDNKGYQFKDASDLAGGLLSAHLKGVGNAYKLKAKGIDSVDGYGTSASSYDALGAAAIKASGSTSMVNATSGIGRTNVTNSVQGASTLNTAVQAGELASSLATSGGFNPTTGPMSSPFGKVRKLAHYKNARTHKGVDYAVPVGSPVSVPINGIVTKVGNDPQGYGNWVEVTHQNGLTTRYAHLSKIMVSQGQQVQAGQQIALSGNTGGSTGPHLHYETRLNGQPVDPSSVDYAKYNLLTGAAQMQAGIPMEEKQSNISATPDAKVDAMLDQANTESGSSLGGIAGSLSSMLDSAMNNPMLEGFKHMLPQITYKDANGNMVTGSVLDAVKSYGSTISSELAKPPTATSMVSPQSLNSPMKSLDKQSQLKGKTNGSTVGSAENNKQAVVIAQQQQKQAEVGIGRPKAFIDDPELLIAQRQLMGV